MELAWLLEKIIAALIATRAAPFMWNFNDKSDIYKITVTKKKNLAELDLLSADFSTLEASYRLVADWTEDPQSVQREMAAEAGT